MSKPVRTSTLPHIPKTISHSMLLCVAAINSLHHSLPSRGFWWQWCGSISIIVDFVLNTCPILLNHAHILNPQTTFTESYILMSLTFLEEPSLNSLSLTLSNYFILSNTSVSPSAKSMSISFPFLDHSFLLTCCTFLISHTMFSFQDMHFVRYPGISTYITCILFLSRPNIHILKFRP